MDPNAVSGVQTATASTSSTSQANALASLANSQAFLNLFVTQLKYQDPLNPASGADFLAQTAQFTSVEQLTELNQKMAEFADASKMSASSLIGRQVEGSVTGSDGTTSTVTGSVTQVEYGANGEAALQLDDGTLLPLADLTSII